jgi:HlyD family secretion protein
MRRAEAALAQARRDAARAAQLHATGASSDSALEQARLAETSAEREHEEARFAAAAAAAEVEAARAALIAEPGQAARTGTTAMTPPCAGATSCLEARAPGSGQVLRVLEESERIVGAGTPLIEIGEPGALEIVADVLSRDAVRITAGTPVEIVDWGGGEPLEARVRRVEPAGFTKISALGVEEQRVNIVIDLVAPDARLGDGYRVEVRIVTWQGDDVLQIPASALFRDGEQWAVFAVEDGRARRRSVDIGAQATFEVEVRDGLAEGETVILHPSDRLEDGSRVEPR